MKILSFSKSHIKQMIWARMCQQGTALCRHRASRRRQAKRRQTDHPQRYYTTMPLHPQPPELFRTKSYSRQISQRRNGSLFFQRRSVTALLEKIVGGDFGLDNTACLRALQTVCRDKRQMTCVVRPGFTDECRNLFAQTDGFFFSDFVFSCRVFDLA